VRVLADEADECDPVEAAFASGVDSDCGGLFRDCRAPWRGGAAAGLYPVADRSLGRGLTPVCLPLAILGKERTMSLDLPLPRGRHV
jgi:hypothetical protein